MKQFDRGRKIAGAYYYIHKKASMIKIKKERLS